jgi:cation diffusion facilitator family transporter
LAGGRLNAPGIDDPEVHRKRRRIATVSVVAAACLTVAKFVTALLTNSLAMYAESGHSAVDAIAVIVTLIAIYHAAKPPDRDHPYGHAKFESIAAMFEIMLLIAIGVLILYHGFERLMDGPGEVSVGWIAVAVMTVSVIVEGWRAIALRRAAQQTGSEALAASSVHFMTDFLDSFVVIFGLVVTAIGFPVADLIAALFVSGVIFMLAWQLSQKVLSTLTDRAPDGVTDEIRQLVLNVEGVIGVHDIRVRKAGPQMFTEMHVDMKSDMSLARVHDILDDIENAVHTTYPMMHVATHPEPIDRHLKKTAQ